MGNHKDEKCTTVNVERFSGLNFHSFYGFQDYRERFSITISASL